jgi:hypothetical protein
MLLHNQSAKCPLCIWTCCHDSLLLAMPCNRACICFLYACSSKQLNHRWTPALPPGWWGMLQHRTVPCSFCVCLRLGRGPMDCCV